MSLYVGSTLLLHTVQHSSTQLPPPPPHVAQTPTGDCVDSHELCAEFAAGGRCDASRLAMEQICPRACGFCGGAAGIGRGGANASPAVACEDSDLAWCAERAAPGACARDGRLAAICARSCGVCGLRQATPPVSADCVDAHTACGAWARGGECTRNALTMGFECPLSCELCVQPAKPAGAAAVSRRPPPPPQASNETCFDDDARCAEWARSGACERRAPEARRSCPYSCKLCRPFARRATRPRCDDLTGDCLDWRERGECTHNRVRMALVCARTCGYCAGSGAPHPPPPPRRRSTPPAPPPCADTVRDCAGWAYNGECERSAREMQRVCPESCGVCGDAPAARERPAPVVATSDERCTDELSAEECAESAALCAEPVLGRLCAKSCGLCGDAPPDADAGAAEADIATDGGGAADGDGAVEDLPPADDEAAAGEAAAGAHDAGGSADADGSECVDAADDCAGWAKEGECERNAEAMAAHCPRACGVCAPEGQGGDGCTDTAVGCAGWAERGECERNAEAMAARCPRSCGACDRKRGGGGGGQRGGRGGHRHARKRASAKPKAAGGGGGGVERAGGRLSEAYLTAHAGALCPVVTAASDSDFIAARGLVGTAQEALASDAVVVLYDLGLGAAYRQELAAMCAVVVRPYARAADALTPWKPALIVEASRQFGCFVWADPQVRFAPLAGGDGGLMAALRAELGVRGVLALRSPGSLAEHCHPDALRGAGVEPTEALWVAGMVDGALLGVNTSSTAAPVGALLEEWAALSLNPALVVPPTAAAARCDACVCDDAAVRAAWGEACAPPRCFRCHKREAALLSALLHLYALDVDALTAWHAPPAPLAAAVLPAVSRSSKRFLTHPRYCSGPKAGKG